MAGVGFLKFQAHGHPCRADLGHNKQAIRFSFVVRKDGLHSIFSSPEQEAPAESQDRGRRLCGPRCAQVVDPALGECTPVRDTRYIAGRFRAPGPDEGLPSLLLVAQRLAVVLKVWSPSLPRTMAGILWQYYVVL